MRTIFRLLRGDSGQVFTWSEHESNISTSVQCLNPIYIRNISWNGEQIGKFNLHHFNRTSTCFSVHYFHVYTRLFSDHHIEQDYCRIREDIFIDDLYLVNSVINNRCRSPVLSILTPAINRQMDLSKLGTSYFQNTRICDFVTSSSHHLCNCLSYLYSFPEQKYSLNQCKSFSLTNHSDFQCTIDNHSNSIFASITLSFKEILANMCIFLIIFLSSLVIIMDIRKKDSTISVTRQKHHRIKSPTSKKNIRRSRSTIVRRPSCSQKPDLETILEECDIVSSVS